MCSNYDRAVEAAAEALGDTEGLVSRRAVEAAAPHIRAGLPRMHERAIRAEKRAKRAEAELSHYGRTAKEMDEENAVLRRQLHTTENLVAFWRDQYRAAAEALGQEMERRP